MAATYELIESKTLGSAQSSVEFTTISSSFTDLILIINEKNTSGGADAMVLQLGNGSIDTGNNYSTTFLYGSGSGSGTSGRQSNAGYIQFSRSTSTNETVTIAQIQNYSNTSIYKTVLSRGNDVSGLVWAAVGLWRSTSVINRLKVYNDGGGTFISGSTFSLYGILAA